MQASELPTLPVLLVAFGLVGAAPASAAPDNRPPPNKVQKLPPVSELRQLCKNAALQNIDEPQDPAFAKHVPLYVETDEPIDNYGIVKLDFDPPTTTRNYWTGFSCLFTWPKWQPDLVILEKEVTKRPPLSELRERCMSGAVRAARQPEDVALARRLPSYVETDDVSADPDGDATIDFTAPRRKRGAWPRLTCHLAGTWWKPELTLFEPEGDGGATPRPLRYPP